MSEAAVPHSPVSASDGSVAHALRRLSVYIRRNAGYYALWSVMALGYVATFVAIPVLVGQAIQAAVDGVAQQELTRRCAWLFAVVIVRMFLRYYSRALVFNAAREVEYELRNDLFAHLQRLPQSFYFDWRTGDLMSRAVNDLNALRLLLGPGLLSVVQTPILFAGVFIAMAGISPKLALLVMLPYPLFVVVGRLFGGAMHARNLAVQQGLGEMSNQVQESVAGIAVVKAYAMEAEQERRFGESAEALLRKQLRLVHINAALPTITGMLPAGAMCILLYFGGAEITAGTMNPGEFFTFAMYIFALTFPTFIMGWVVALVQRGAAAMQRIDEVLSIEPSIADHHEVESMDRLSGEIEFRNLTFHYYSRAADVARDAALCDVSFAVPRGSSLGVVGRVGSGKSTLASLIPRLYEVDEGQLFLDGIDVNRIPLTTLRSSIAMVPQDSFLFSMSLAENVAYGLPEVDHDRVREASERAQLHKDVAELPDGYQTLVGERGVMLSGGQRQRTALARALALRPSILILDDTLSSVDAETESEIRRQLEGVFDGLTVIMIASRVSTVSDCDRIIVLDEGRIVERGSHQELIAQGGLYARMAEEQAREPRAPVERAS